MATMIPSTGPRDCTAASQETRMYEALKRLPSDYYVVHSMQMLVVTDNQIHDGEADFIVFNPRLGIICIEAKAGRIRYEDGQWKYGSGRLIHHGDGPYAQARSVMFKLRSVFEDKGLGRLLSRLKLHTAVWFPGITRDELESLPLPPESGPRWRDKSITLTREDLDSPLNTIERILSLNTPKAHETSLTKTEMRQVLERIICPTFELVPSLDSYVQANQEREMVRLIEGQKRVLDFIADESFVVIQGMSGTGKTLVAAEQARRCAQGGKRVLFLCYNKLLRDDLERHLSDCKGITVFTLAQFCYQYTRRSDRFESLCEHLDSFDSCGGFPYQSVIVDEAQDFGDEALVEYGFFESLHGITSQCGGSLFAFYDPSQRVQSRLFPEYLLSADTQLALRVNCRNTQEIAFCSQAALGLVPDDRFLSRSVNGETPRIVFTEGNYVKRINALNNEINYYHEHGVDDIVILTCQSMKRTGIGEYCEKEYDDYGKLIRLQYEGDVPVYSCRTFKGLEADAIILIMVTANCWLANDELTAEPGGLVYVGASRAKRYLSLICEMDDSGCDMVLRRLTDTEGGRRPRNKFAKELGAELVTELEYLG